AVIAGAFDDSECAGIAHAKTLARAPRRKQTAARRTVQTGVADDGRVLRFERRIARWIYHQLAAGHALADIVVGIAFQIHMQTTGVPDTKTLAGRARQTQHDRRVGHAEIAITFGDFPGQARPDRTIAIADVETEFTAAFALYRGLRCRPHLLGLESLIKRRIRGCMAELRLAIGLRVFPQD